MDLKRKYSFLAQTEEIVMADQEVIYIQDDDSSDDSSDDSDLDSSSSDSSDEWTPLHDAARDNNLVLVNELLAQGANVNETNDVLRTPLHVAAMSNVDESHFQVIKTLLSKKAVVDAQNR